MAVTIRLLGSADAALIATAADVFDHCPQAHLTAEFLQDPRHHLIAAIDDSQLVGFISAVHYVHPDKPAELWINEVGVAPSHQGQGIGRQMLRLVLEHGKKLGCVNAWVLTDRNNPAAMGLYAGAGGVEAEKPAVMFEFDLEGGESITESQP